MSNELTQSDVASANAVELNEDGSLTTWVTQVTDDQRFRKTIKLILAGFGLTLVVWSLQYRNDVLGENWPMGLWLLGISLLFGLNAFVTKEIRHYSTYYVAYTTKQRLSRAWKWWVGPSVICIILMVIQFNLDQLAEHWGAALFVLIFTLPGFGLYMLRGEKVLTPAAAKTKSAIDATAIEAPRLNPKKSRAEELIEEYLEIPWVRYPLAAGCFWVAIWALENTFKKEIIGYLVAFVAAGCGVYFSRELSKWLLWLVGIGLILWLVVAGLSALSIPAAIILGAIIIASSGAKR